MAQCLRDEQGGCRRCDAELGFDITMAFQPILDIETGTPFAFEALVRGTQGESAGEILSRVEKRSLYRFDQRCRVRALEIAHRIGCQHPVSINFLPDAVYEPHACIQATLATADKLGWPPARIMFEVTESEYVRDRRHLQNIVETYRAMGFWTALDDFGAGFANLELLVDLRPDVVKIDRHLIAGVASAPRRQAIVESLIMLAQRLGIRLVAEGVETLAEAHWLYRNGIRLQQGYYFARPSIENLPGCSEPTFAAVREGG